MTTRRIEKLGQDVVNRIAAGEVVHRPASALKEMLENSLDAESTTVTVLAEGGGMKRLQIQDNGKGIHRDDLPIVCERFATSKLRKFEDLEGITTYGFRGEALASISNVAHVSVTSMTPDAPCAFTGQFKDGALIPPRPGAKAEPRPTAGVPGTQITVEDMFYNMPTRRRALRHATEEYNRILDVICRYAVHHCVRGVSFSCRKAGQAAPDVQVGAASSRKETIRSIYGRSLSEELLPLEYKAESSDADSLQCNVTGLVSNANFSMKKALEGVYSEFLPKNSHPFLYLSLELPGHHVDVNVHPTKREVHFLHEDELLDRLVDSLRATLADANASRTFYTQTLLTAPDSEAPRRGNDSRTTTTADGGRDTAGTTTTTTAAEGGVGRAGSSARGRTMARNVQSPAMPLTRPDAETSVSRRQASPMEPTDHVLRKKKEASSRKVRTDASARTLDPFVVRSAPYSEKQDEAEEEEEQDNRRRPASAPVDACCDPSSELQWWGTPASVGGADFPRQRRKRPRGHVQQGDEASEQGSEARSAAVAVEDPVAAADQRRASVKAKSAQPARMRPIEVTAILELISEIEQQASPALTQMIQRHSFVGVVDEELSLIQHETKLLLVNHVSFSRELFYQRSLRLFGNVVPFSLDPPPSIRDLSRLGLEARTPPADRDNPTVLQEMEEAIQEICRLLVANGPLLWEHFGIQIEPCGNDNESSDPTTTPSRRGDARLRSLPRLVDNYTPSLWALPDFILDLAFHVEWSQEQECFRTIAAALGDFYARFPPLPESTTPAVGSVNSDDDDDDEEAHRTRRAQEHAARLEEHRRDRDSLFWIVEHELFPAMRRNLAPSPMLARDHNVVQLARTEQLYKIFERC